MHELVGKEDGKRLITNDIARAPDCMTKPQWLLLPNIDTVARCEPRVRQHRHVLAARRHRMFKFKRNVEMIFNGAFAAASNEDHLLDPRLPRLVNRILNQWAVHDGQHFLGDGFRRWQETGS